MPSQNRLVIITNGNHYARVILEGVLAAYAENIAGVVIITGDYKGMTGLRSLYTLSKVTTWPYLIYKIFSLLTFKLGQLLHPKHYYSLKSLTEKLNIPTMFGDSIKSQGIFDWIKERKPNLIISVSCPQLIGKKILDLSTRGGINIHSSLLPVYAGLAPYYWALSKNESETGTTVHYMTAKFDTGNILVQKHLQIKPGISAFNLFQQLSELGRAALLEAVERALRDEIGVLQNLESRSYYSNPDLRSYKVLKRNGFYLIRLSDWFNILTGKKNGAI